MATALQLARLVAVLALLMVAALLATPPGRLPLALRGLCRILHHDRGERMPALSAPAPGWKRALALLLVLAALVIALL